MSKRTVLFLRVVVITAALATGLGIAAAQATPASSPTHDAAVSQTVSAHTTLLAEDAPTPPLGADERDRDRQDRRKKLQEAIKKQKDQQNSEANAPKPAGTDKPAAAKGDKPAATKSDKPAANTPAGPALLDPSEKRKERRDERMKKFADEKKKEKEDADKKKAEDAKKPAGGDKAKSPSPADSAPKAAGPKTAGDPPTVKKQNEHHRFQWQDRP